MCFAWKHPLGSQPQRVNAAPELSTWVAMKVALLDFVSLLVQYKLGIDPKDSPFGTENAEPTRISVSH